MATSTTSTSASSGIGRRPLTCRRSPNQVSTHTRGPVGGRWHARTHAPATARRSPRNRAHAPSGDRLAIAAYLGAGSRFDKAIARFSEAYADQNELDHGRLADSVAV